MVIVPLLLSTVPYGISTTAGAAVLMADVLPRPGAGFGGNLARAASGAVGASLINNLPA